MGTKEEAGGGEGLIEPTAVVAVVTSDAKLVEQFGEDPFALAYQRFSGRERKLIDKILECNPSAVIVVSDHGESLTSWSSVCEEMKKRTAAIPVVFLHQGEYDHLDLDHVTDLEARLPGSSEERCVLLWEVVRLIYRIRRPRISLKSSRSIQWRLGIGIISALLAGSILLAVTTDLEAALTTAAATFSAITGMEALDSTRRHLSRRTEGSTSRSGFFRR